MCTGSQTDSPITDEGATRAGHGSGHAAPSDSIFRMIQEATLVAAVLPDLCPLCLHLPGRSC